MNEIIKFLSAGDKFMPEMHLKQSGFTYSVCGPLTKNKESIQKFKEAGDTRYKYKNELDKACFQHYMAYGELQLQIKYYVTKHLILLKIQNKKNIKEVLFLNFLIKTFFTCR